MSFVSLQFALFLPVTVAGCFLLPRRIRWAWLLGASYYFYMSWRPAYLLLILASTLIDYAVALGLDRSTRRGPRRGLLGLSLMVNLTLLFAFKYFNFLNHALAQALARLGIDYAVPDLDLLLPVGISFYTFQTLSYTIDVYRGSRSAERHLGIFALYVALFPQLVAGPIERSTHLLPQLRATPSFDTRRLSQGADRILWGVFKKLVIADRLGLYVDQIYHDPGAHTGAPLILATYLFAFQIYCDFSAYSDIAIGCARLLGVDLMENFHFPYQARSLTEFWQRWHISLSTWFRDYLYIPLGGSRSGPWRNAVTLGVVFLLSGLWHGANWTFAAWGLYHGALILIGRTTRAVRMRCLRAWGISQRPVLHGWLARLITFHAVVVGWVLFRASTLGEAWLVLSRGWRVDLTRLGINLHVLPAGRWQIPDVGRVELILALASIAVLLVVESLQRRSLEPAAFLPRRGPLRWVASYALISAILLFGEFGGTPFIYFQF